MFCMNCGKKISSKDKFCENCGTSVEASMKNVEETKEKEVVKEEPTIEKAKEIKEEAKAIVDTSFVPKKKKKKTLKVLICLLVVALLAGGGLAFYYFTNNTPTKAFTKAIDQFTDGLIGNLDNDVKTEKGTVKVQAKVKTSSLDSSMMQLVDLLADTDLVLKYELDRDNKIFNFDMDVNYEGRELIGVDATMDEYNMYFRFDESQKYLKAALEEGQNVFEIFKSMDDTKEIVNGLSKALKSSLKDKYFEKESDEITIDGDDVKVTKNTLILNKDNFLDILNDVIDNVNKDDDLLKVLAKATDMDKEELKNALQMAKANLISSSVEDFPTIKISIYTKGFNNDIVRYEIEAEGSKIGITKVDDESYTFDVMGIKLGSLKITGDDNDKEITLTIGYMGEEVTISAKITRETDVKVKEKDTYGAISIDNVPSNYFDSVTRKLTNSKFYTTISKLMYSNSGYSNNSYYLYD